MVSLLNRMLVFKEVIILENTKAIEGNVLPILSKPEAFSFKGYNYNKYTYLSYYVIPPRMRGNPLFLAVRSQFSCN